MLTKKLLLALTLLTSLSTEAQPFDCTQPRPEMPGFHNMVLFGHPSDKLYAYHLPLFAGQVNGESGHVLMHVYQGIWSVNLDETTKQAYAQKFAEKQTTTSPLPFFSFNPRGERFKVPEMICQTEFSTQALAVYGHVEGNPAFPAPEPLLTQTSVVKTQATIFAQRFNGSSKSELTYVLFGTPKQYYLAHYLTDDENSFDQIVAINLLDMNLARQLQAISSTGKSVVVEISVADNPTLIGVQGHAQLLSPNNKWKLPTNTSAVIKLKAHINGSLIDSSAQIVSEVYFNKDSDLSVK